MLPIQCRKIYRCAAVQFHQSADSFIKGVQLLFVLGGISVLGQLEVLLDKGVVDGLQLGMGGGSILDLGDCPHTVFVLLQLPTERGGGLPECPMLIHAEAAAALFRSDVQPMIVPITDRRYARRIMCTSMEARPVSVKKPAAERSGVNKAR